MSKMEIVKEKISKNDKTMSLPKGWEMKKLGRVLMIERGGSPRPIQKYLTSSNDGYNWIKIADATASNKYIYETKEKITKEGLHKTRLVYEGDFILSNSMSFGRPYIMKTTGCIHDGWLVLRQNGTKIFETDFLYYLLSSPFVYNQFNSLAAGSTVRNLNIGLVSSVSVPIPPLPEQHRIVSVLDRSFAAIDKAKANAEQNLKNAKELFESYLTEIFEKKGEDWEEQRLGDVCEYDKISNKRNDLVYVGLEDIQSNTGMFIGTFEPRNVKSSTFYFNHEHILYGRLRPYLNKVLIPNFEGHCSTEIFPIKPKKNILDRGFLFRWLISVKTMEKINATWTGATLPRANMNTVLDFKINLPSLEKQQSIVRKLDSLRSETQKLESIYTKKILALEELKKSILQKAFRGEI